MPNPTDDTIAQLAREFPRWQIWLVPGVAGGPATWCARRWTDVDAVPAKVINADSPEHLAEYIADEVSR